MPSESHSYESYESLFVQALMAQYALGGGKKRRDNMTSRKSGLLGSSNLVRLELG